MAGLRNEEQVRRPAVAGLFYPADPDTLARAVADYLAAASATAGKAKGSAVPPKALIAPHAGYIYSGPIAASAYALLRDTGTRIRRVVLIGPSHRVAFAGLALPGARIFATPLGDVPVDAEATARLRDLPQIHVRDDAHGPEHSLEVHLPFLQAVLADFSLVPLVVGGATVDEVAEILDLLWGGEETLIVVSSDLSHYHDYHTARELDAATARAVEALRPEEIDTEQACGCLPVGGLLTVARRRGLTARLLDLRNSGDTAGPRKEVVGYGAFAVA